MQPINASALHTNLAHYQQAQCIYIVSVQVSYSVTLFL